MKRAKPKPTRVRLTLHPRVAEHVRDLHATGLYGRNITKVVEGLFLAGLREALGIGARHDDE